MKGLTSHVLDTLHGTPARGVQVQLWKLPYTDSDLGVLLSQQFTGEEGRCHLMDELAIGEYELRFDLGTYFRKKLGEDEKKTFLNVVPVRFYVDDPEQHFHIPLVASPWAYSTYKGGAPKHGVNK